jgi:hypothetical protein
LNKTGKNRRRTLREESLAENKALGLEQIQEQMDVIFAILHRHGINARLWLEEVIASCQANGQNLSADFEKFLPWNLNPEMRDRLSKDSTFSYGKAQFLEKNDGTVYHLRQDGAKVKVKFADMTGDEFEQLIGVR